MPWQPGEQTQEYIQTDQTTYYQTSGRPRAEPRVNKSYRFPEGKKDLRTVYCYSFRHLVLMRYVNA